MRQGLGEMERSCSVLQMHKEGSGIIENCQFWSKTWWEQWSRRHHMLWVLRNIRILVKVEELCSWNLWEEKTKVPLVDYINKSHHLFIRWQAAQAVLEKATCPSCTTSALLCLPAQHLMLHLPFLPLQSGLGQTQSKGVPSSNENWCLLLDT